MLLFRLPRVIILRMLLYLHLISRQQFPLLGDLQTILFTSVKCLENMKPHTTYSVLSHIHQHLHKIIQILGL